MTNNFSTGGSLLKCKNSWIIIFSIGFVCLFFWAIFIISFFMGIWANNSGDFVPWVLRNVKEHPIVAFISGFFALYSLLFINKMDKNNS
jgi:hypothetical protein